MGFQLVNERGQQTSQEIRYFEKISKLHKPLRVRNPQMGLKYSYYEGSWGMWPEFKDLKEQSKGIAKDFWVSDYALREDQFALVLTGYMEVEEDGMYIFQSRSDDACRLIIQGETVVNQDPVEENAKMVGAIALQKGFHPVTIHFMEAAGRERLRLSMKRTYDTQWEPLEIKDRFYH